MTKKETKFQRELVGEIGHRFPGSMVLRLDPHHIQGIPDLLILHKDRWASLECKRSRRASHRPNQDYYVDKMNKMSFSRFIFPENKKSVIRELCSFFKCARGGTR